MPLTKTFIHKGHDAYNEEVNAWVTSVEAANPGKYVDVRTNTQNTVDGQVIVTVTYELTDEPWYDRA